jgi:Icc-related predicted phosphoesterase
VAKSRVYFITDVHGSNRCFKKFLNAASFYKADVIILGGDITGKVMIPIVEEGDGTFSCTYQGSDLVLRSKE